MKSLLDQNKTNNTVVNVIFYMHNPTINTREKLTGTGVLLRESEEKIRIAFNASNNKAVDYIDINRDDLISLRLSDENNIIYLD